MNKTTIISIVAIIVVVLGIIWIAQSGSDTNNAVAAKSNGILTVEEHNDFDFGDVSMAAGKVKHEFKIKNTSAEAVVINKMYSSCMCTVASLITPNKKFGPFGMPGHGFVPSIDQAVNPNDEVAIEVVFDPAAHGPAGVGRIERVVTLENNAGEPIELSFAAMVTP